MTATQTTGTTDLANALIELGVEVTRSNGREIIGKCPVHVYRVGKADNSPSWSMNSENGLWICFSCGAKGTLGSLIAEITGNFEDTMAAHRLMMDVGLRQMNRGGYVEEVPDVDWISYSKFSSVPDKVARRRNLDPQALRMYGVKWHDEKKAWIIPTVSPAGDLLGWQEKGADWYRNQPKGVKKSGTLFGIERSHSRTIVLVESPLDVVRMASCLSGIQALAAFGAHVSAEQMRLLADVADKVIVAMDNDEAGIKSGKRLMKEMPLLRGGLFWLDYRHAPDAKDIGEMTDEQIYNCVVNASILPWWADGF